MPEQETQLAPNPAAAEQVGQWLALQPVLEEVARERLAQLAQWGDQPLPLGFGWADSKPLADAHRKACDDAARDGRATHRHVLLEEVWEALAESDLPKARDELIQVAAVAVKIIQDIDRMQASGVLAVLPPEENRG